jgi:hypothetical protein
VDQETKKAGRKRSMKKDMLIALAIVGGVLLLLLLLVTLLEERETQGNTSQNGEQQFKFSDEYITDIDEFLSDEGYLDKDRTLYYHNAAHGTTVSIEDGEDYGQCVEFLRGMVDAILAGDADAYNACFSDLYFTKAERQGEFSMQKLYDIIIGTYSEEKVTENGQTYTKYVYTLEYKIRRNNGSLRSDMGSNGSRTQYLLITDREGKLLIDGVATYN